MATAECIHGFEAGMCDQCYPKAVPEKPKVARAAAPPKRTAGAVRTRVVNLAEQRVYHVTHVRNLEHILETGGLVAGTTPAIDLSSELTRELRSTAEVSPGESVADYVPFYLSPVATLWEELRRGAAEPRWSPAARTAASTDFVLLVTTVRALGDAVIADGDAAGSYTRFATTPDSVEGMLGRLHGTDAALDAEALVKGSFDFAEVTLIGVANDPARARVKTMLDDANFATKVAVYPPWFMA